MRRQTDKTGSRRFNRIEEKSSGGSPGEIRGRKFMTPLPKLTRMAAHCWLGGISLAAAVAVVPVAAQQAVDPLKESPGQSAVPSEFPPLSGADRTDPSDERASVQSTLKTETEIIRSLAPFADGNPVARPREPRAVDSDRGKVRVDYGRAIDMTVFFDYDSARLISEAGLQLQPLGQALQSRELLPYRFLIAGHTDASGDPAYNRSLSLKRAATVRSYLSETFGIDPLRLVIHGWGQSRLKDPARPYDGINRRVEIALIVSNASSDINGREFARNRQHGTHLVPAGRLMLDQYGMNVRTVDPDTARWPGAACRGPAFAMGWKALSDPRWQLPRFALDDFGATPTLPCRTHGADLRIGTGSFTPDPFTLDRP